ERRAYAAVAPLVGLAVGTQVELGGGLRVRAAATGELAGHWPEAQGLLPPGFGREVDRYCVLELERALDAGEDAPDAPAELADAGGAPRAPRRHVAAAGGRVARAGGPCPRGAPRAASDARRGRRRDSRGRRRDQARARRMRPAPRPRFVDGSPRRGAARPRAG